MSKPIMQSHHTRVTCSAGCAGAYREDRRHGAIYGPWVIPDVDMPQGIRFVSPEQACAYAGTCAYCRGPLPRGRDGRLLAYLMDRQRARDKVLSAEVGQRHA